MGRDNVPLLSWDKRCVTVRCASAIASFLSGLRGLIFSEPLEGGVTIILRQSRTQHEKDYIKQGSLRASKSKACSAPEFLKQLTRAEESWSGELTKVLCLEITLDKPQEDWIAVREILINRNERKAPQDFLPKRDKAQRVESQHATPHNSPYALQHALAAAMLGFAAGSVAWLVIHHGRRQESRVIRSMGCFAPWTVTFLSLLDIGLALMRPEGRPEAQEEAKEVPLVGKPCPNSRHSRKKLPIDWQWLQPGISFLGTSVKHMGPGRDPREHPARRFMSIGIVAQVQMDVVGLARSVLQLAKGGNVTVALLLGRAREASPESRSSFLQALREQIQGQLVSEDHLHLLDPAETLYPPAPTRRENVDLALLTAFLEPLADAFMLVEPDCSVAPDFSETIRRYTDVLDSSAIPWIAVEFSPQGFMRKLLRSRLLRRFRVARQRMVAVVCSGFADRLAYTKLSSTCLQQLPFGSIVTEPKRSSRRNGSLNSNRIRIETYVWYKAS